jgi:hypothetical protein
MFNPTGVGRLQRLGPSSGYASSFLSLKRTTLLVPAEIAALRLFEVVSQTKDYLICPQVHILQMFDFNEQAFRVHVADTVKQDFVRPEYAPNVDKLLKSWSTNRAYRSVDFVFCDPKTTEVQFGIEIDDPSHLTPERRDVDEIKDMMFASVGLPLYRFTNAQILMVAQLPPAAWQASFDPLADAAEKAWVLREAHFFRKPEPIQQYPVG